MRKCTGCGAEIGENERYCTQCGQNNENFADPFESGGHNSDYSGPNSGGQTTNYYYNPPPSNYGSGYDNNYNYNNPPPHQQNYAPPVSSAYAVLAIIFGALGGWLGLLFGIIGLTKYKTTGLRVACIIGIVLFVAWIPLTVLVYPYIYY